MVVFHHKCPYGDHSEKTFRVFAEKFFLFFRPKTAFQADYPSN